jgi:gluconolactonase
MAPHLAACCRPALPVASGAVTVNVLDQRLLDLVEEGAELERLGTGFTFSEGPIWVPRGGYLLFADVPASRRFRWDETHGVREVAAPTALGNGMTIDLEGRLLVCEGETGAVVRMDASGTGSGREIVASSYRGRRLNSPNDVVVRGDGSIWFTDSWWPNRLGRTLEQELDFQGVFRVVDGGEPELEIGDMDFPNGLCFSPDESLLYANDSTPGRIRVFDVSAEGTLSGDRIFGDGITDASGHVDGMKCDEQGNVWVTGPGGVWVLDPSGVHLGTIATPQRTGNIHWGGPSWDWLFVTCSSGLYRLRTRVRGRREPFMH